MYFIETVFMQYILIMVSLPNSSEILSTTAPIQIYIPFDLSH